MVSSSPQPADPDERGHRLRSGTAARLAGLPATTLRVWERRYGVVSAQKSAGGQRIYTMRDVARLKRLRELTETGHAIGTIASLDLEALDALQSARSALSARPTESAHRDLDLVVVGSAATHLLKAMRGCTLRAVYDDLDQAEHDAPQALKGSLLLVRLPSLQPALVDRVLSVAAAFEARAMFVLYAFGSRASIRSLQDAGATVRREPSTTGDLEQWIRGIRNARPSSTPSVDIEGPIAARMFSDEMLSRLSTMQSSVACECLRHMSEVVSQLAGFERYSRECVSVGPADAALHRHLSRVAGSARAMFEQALQRAMSERGLELEHAAG